MEGPTHSFKEVSPCASAQIMAKTVTSYSSRKKRGHFFYCLFCLKDILFEYAPPKQKNTNKQHIRTNLKLSKYLMLKLVALCNLKHRDWGCSSRFTQCHHQIK